MHGELFRCDLFYKSLLFKKNMIHELCAQVKYLRLFGTLHIVADPIDLFTRLTETVVWILGKIICKAMKYEWGSGYVFLTTSTNFIFSPSDWLA